LSDKGTLRNSFTYQADATRMVLGTAVKYAAAHHFGLNKAVSVPGHRRLVKKAWGRTLKFPVWAQVKERTFNPKIAARPFLMIQEGDKAAILRILRRHLES
jgi:phage gpG-like protein